MAKCDTMDEQNGGLRHGGISGLRGSWAAQELEAEAPERAGNATKKTALSLGLRRPRAVQVS